MFGRRCTRVVKDHPLSLTKLLLPSLLPNPEDTRSTSSFNQQCLFIIFVKSFTRACFQQMRTFSQKNSKSDPHFHFWHFNPNNFPLRCENGLMFAYLLVCLGHKRYMSTCVGRSQHTHWQSISLIWGRDR